MPSDVFQQPVQAGLSARRSLRRSLLALVALGLLWTLYSEFSPTAPSPAFQPVDSPAGQVQGPLTEKAYWASEALTRLRVKAAQAAGSRWSSIWGLDGSLDEVDDSPVSRWKQLGWETTPNGLVVLPEMGEGAVLHRHPIELLMEEAALKVQKQKREKALSLPYAVAQYRKMFNSEPPLGFDKWFTAFDPPPSILPKAHDQLVPFLSMPGIILKQRTKRLDGVIQTFSIEFKDGKVLAVEGKEAKSRRARDILDLLEPVAHLIPDLKVYFNVDDVPRQIAHARVLNATTFWGSRNELWPIGERVAWEESQGGTNGYYWPCGRDTPVGMESADIILTPEIKEGQGKMKFIWDHAKAMDYCLDPELLKEHSLFIYGHPQPDVLIPMFSYCRSAHNMDLYGIPMDAVRSDVPHIPWSEKTISKVYWRGQATGMFANKDLNWRSSQRHRLHRFTHPSADARKVAILVPSKIGKGWVESRERPVDLAKKWFDVELVGGPMQCDREDGTCDEMDAETVFGERRDATEATKYKFVVDVDGNGWSSRFRRLLLGGSVVLKSTVYPEWYSEELVPFYHYVPLQVSYNFDMYNLLSFFTSRPDLARQIGENGRQFALENWSWESMQAYYLLSLLEYARALSDDREGMTYRKSTA